jgi:hypothetical protein
MRPLEIDPNKPSHEEVVTHNMKVAKANLACEIIKYSVGNAGFFFEGKPSLDAIELGKFAVGLAEAVIETFSMMPDAGGKRGGVVS